MRCASWSLNSYRFAAHPPRYSGLDPLQGQLLLPSCTLFGLREARTWGVLETQIFRSRSVVDVMAPLSPLVTTRAQRRGRVGGTIGAERVGWTLGQRLQGDGVLHDGRGLPEAVVLFWTLSPYGNSQSPLYHIDCT
jgi:hypothetical protein